MYDILIAYLANFPIFYFIKHFLIVYFRKIVYGRFQKLLPLFKYIVIVIV